MGDLEVNKMENRAISCILFDFDGTLINSLDNLYNSYNDFLKIYNFIGNKSEFKDLNGPSIYEIVLILKNKYKFTDDIEEAYQTYINCINNNYSNSKPNPFAESVLKKFKDENKKIGLVTSGKKEICLPIIEKLKWNDYFDFFLWGSDVRISKPNPEIYIKAHKKSGCKKNEIIVVEDSINGVKAACGAGLIVIGLSIDTGPEELKNAGAIKVISCLSKLDDFVG
jgi:HAD superfamily hydrolase (TIGR01509 family)